MKPDIFVGITSWDSEAFLPLCLDSLWNTLEGVRARIVVLDNVSSDGSAAVARAHRAEVISKRCSQSQALNHLLARSNAPITLLMHADLVFLSPRWFETCAAHLRGDCILVSPEDIGCGPLSRPFGRDMPESSFLFFSTRGIRSTRLLIWPRFRWIPYPSRQVDFFGDHITHNLPGRLQTHGYTWQPMQVHISPRVDEPIYEPAFDPGCWTPELPYLRYGLGNFYSLGGEITHYHNWYDRRQTSLPLDSRETTEPGTAGIPLAYIRAYTERFLADYKAGRLVIPPPVAPAREPRSIRVGDP